MARVLVAYASKYGSTREIAEAVARRLGGRGVEVEVRAAGEVRNLAGFSAVVLGVALYFFRWRGDASRFVRRNRKALSAVPVAVFGSGPMEDKAEQYTGAREHLDKGLAKHPWLKPAAVTVFGGRFDPTGLRFPDNMPAVRAMAPVDLRDWDAIDAWADELPGELGID